MARIPVTPGRGGPYIPPKEPTVIIALGLNVEPSRLSIKSEKPFYLEVTARCVKTPEPERPITFAHVGTPFQSLHNRNFTNIVCINGPGNAPKITDSGAPDLSGPHNIYCTQDPGDGAPKHVMLWPMGWPLHRGPDTPNLARGPSGWKFFTVPPPGKGRLTYKQEVGREKIAGANIGPGERYRVAITNKNLSTLWWSYGDLGGKRPRKWLPPDELGKQPDDVALADDYERGMDPDSAAELRMSAQEAGVWERGEDPKEFMFVFEDEGRGAIVDFDVVD